MSVKPKNLLVVTHYWVPHVGGLEIVAKQQAQSFAKAGNAVSVVTSAPYGKAQGESKDEYGVIIHRVAVWNFLDKHFSIPIPIGGIALIRKLYREVSRADAIYIHDIFYETSWIAYLIARLKRKPIFLTQHVGIVKHAGPIIFIERMVYATWGRLIFNYSKSIVVYNHYVKIFLIDHGVDPDKILEVRNGIDLSIFHPAKPEEKIELRRQFDLPDEKPVVLFVGRFVPKKGFLTLLEARDAEYDLAFAGSGEIPSEWKNVPGIHIIGSLSQTELAKLYRAADIFALPARGEFFTLAMQEAMASGLPVITTDEPEYREYEIDRKLISFVEPTSGELKKEIKRLIGDKNLLSEMSKYSVQLAERWFNWEENLKNQNQAHIPSLIVVAPYFYPKIGGVESYAYNIAKRLNASGEYRVSIITSNEKTAGYRKDEIEGMTIYKLPILFTLSNTPINLKWRQMIKEIFAEENPDIIHLHSPVPFMSDIAASVAKDTPIVLTYHSGSMAKGRWPIDILINAYEKIFLRKLFKRVDVVAAYHKKFMEREIEPFAKKTAMIPPGLDPDQFSATPLLHDSERVMFVGRIEYNSDWKGVEPLLRAMAIVAKHRPWAKLEFIGTGDAVEHYRKLAEELGIGTSVIFSGAMMGKELSRAFERASVIVLPSTSDAESFGIVLIEAMASGRPVIGSNIGGIPDVIDNNKNGLLVPPGDIEALASAIERILGDHELAKQLSSEGIVKARQFDWDIQAEKYRNIFKAILE